MKTTSGVFMLLGLIMGALTLFSAKSAPQEAIALVPIVGGYVFGRMLENFSTSQESKLLKEFLLKLTKKSEDS